MTCVINADVRLKIHSFCMYDNVFFSMLLNNLPFHMLQTALQFIDFFPTGVGGLDTWGGGAYQASGWGGGA